MLRLHLKSKCKTKLSVGQRFRILILCFFVPNIMYGQVDSYYINTSKKNIERAYYFRIMDSLVAASPNDSLYGCINCVRFMKDETEAPSSGKITYFGQFDFTKGDLRKWHAWFDKKYKKRKR